MPLFVVFEGIEGSGKNTQARALTQRLRRARYSVTLVRDPGGTAAGERIRRLLKTEGSVTPLCELFLFVAARALLVEQVLRPALAQGSVVVCNRYIYSTLAYQGYGRGLDLDLIHSLNVYSTRGLLPDLVVLLDLPAEEGLRRKALRPLDRFEREEAAFHRRVREGYLKLAAQDPQRWLVLDGSRPRSRLVQEVWDRVLALLPEPPP